jgi:hypothetical protein
VDSAKRLIRCCYIFSSFSSSSLFALLTGEVRQYLGNFYVRGGDGPSSSISFFSSSEKSLSKASMATDGNLVNDDDLDDLVLAFVPPDLAHPRG